MSTNHLRGNAGLRLGAIAVAALLASCDQGAAAASDRSVASNRSIFASAAAGKTLYLSAFDAASGIELWKSDGTEAGTTLVKNINPGPGSSIPSGLTVFNNVVYFSANDGTNGFELWRSDGTEAGTFLVKDINPGAGGSAPFGFRVADGALYFHADDGSNGFELWRSDGTEAGTVRAHGAAPTLRR